MPIYWYYYEPLGLHTVHWNCCEVLLLLLLIMQPLIFWYTHSPFPNLCYFPHHYFDTFILMLSSIVYRLSFSIHKFFCFFPLWPSQLWPSQLWLSCSDGSFSLTPHSAELSRSSVMILIWIAVLYYVMRQLVETNSDSLDHYCWKKGFKVQVPFALLVRLETTARLSCYIL